MRRSLALAFGAAALVGCERPEPRPGREFLFVTADSTFWVTVTGGQTRTRGAPMLLARVDGRFVELYVADDDRSYYDAVFVGHRLFARDIVRNDSVELHRDTTVTRLAADYARAHPDDVPLGPDDPENENASLHATSDVEILAVHGPFVSYEHHTDVEANDEQRRLHRHAYRRGVVDARTGAPVRLAALFGRAAAESLARAARREWDAARAAVEAGAGVAQHARRAMADFRFDDESFTIGADGQAPTVRFAPPAAGENPDVEPIELSARRAPVPPWWAAVAPEYPAGTGDTATWVHGADTLIASPASDMKGWVVALRARGGERGTVARVSSAVERVLWLDSTLTATDRAALGRAFDEAAAYEGGRQVALARGRPAVHLAAHDSTTFRAARERLALRVVGVDDAAGRERAGPRIWRRAPGDARQDGGRLRDAARAEALRHGLD